MVLIGFRFWFMKEFLCINDLMVIVFVKVFLDGEGIDCFEFDVNMSVFDGSIGILLCCFMVWD